MLPPGRSDQWRVPAGLAGFTVFFYWKILFTNRVMFPWDAATFFYPYLNFVHEELRHFRMPFWDPYVMSGYPIIGDPEAQIFYPINWLLVLLHPSSNLPYKLVEIQIILHFFLAGLFMYYLAKSFVRSTVAALVAAILFEFSGAMVAHTQHLASIDSMAWYPLIFLLARRGLLEGKLFLTVSAGALFGIQVLTGHVQHSVYMGLLLFLYFAYEACCGPARQQLWPRWIYSLAIIGAIGGALALVQLIPSRELGNLSVRSYLTYDNVTQGNEPRFLWTLFLPNYFGGLNGVPKWYPYDISFNYAFLTVPGCLLALLGLIETVRRRNFFWLGLVLLCVELSFGQHGRLGPLIYHVPLLNWFRNIPTFFDLANFALCLLAGIGYEVLFSKNPARPWLRLLPAGLMLLLMSAATVSMTLRLGEKIHGWYAMLAVLALAGIVITGRLRNHLSRPFSQLVLLSLIVGQLLVYNMNELFSWTLEDPRLFISRDIAMSHTGLLRFLRSDQASDFRVAAIADYPLSTNGWNTWRIPSIYGWNPITLRRYDEYLRGFMESGEYTTPYGGPDHNLNSSMLDLLGTKYLIMADADLEKRLRLNESDKFTLIFTDQELWRTFQNRDYFSRAWFYPRAYIASDANVAFALLSSRWFEARRTLLFESGDLPAEHVPLAEQLSTITLTPDQVAGSSGGDLVADPACSQPGPIFTDWPGTKNDWVRFEFPGPDQPGRYVLLVKYTSDSQPTPSLTAQIENGDRQQRSGPFTLPATAEWNCRRSRTADLGAFDVAPGQNRLTIASEVASFMRLYSLWLVRLPQPGTLLESTFAFSNFNVSANRMAFDSRQDRDGFVLLNEIHYPGWEASLDGKPAPILRADGIFRALHAPAGSHHIEMSFRPKHFAWGAAGSLLTVIGLSLYLLRHRRASSSAGCPPEEDSSSRQIPLART